MVSVQKKLSIAFYWHMHQPDYQLSDKGDFLMPWVRMHAVKDYLDMLLIMNDYPHLKLNFNLVPLLVKSLKKYAEEEVHDFHSRLTVSNVEELSADDKMFILNNFFDANYKSMILHHEGYKNLYTKRFEQNISDIDAYTNQEYSDIMAWFNLSWFDPVYADMYPELKELANKGYGFTKEDRIKIIEYQREIIKQIIPTYKKFQDEGRIEITTSPYYHPILPILLDIKSAYRNIPNPEVLPSNLKMAKDAIAQTEMALDTMEEIFGKRPRGIWPPEQCISSKMLDMLSDLGVKWTITDEGILANSINLDFVRDFKGNLSDPYHLLKPYEYKTKNSKINVIFRDSLIPNLISYEYPNTEPEKAANDLYDRIKVIQSKIFASPDEEHLLTIALDGENSWENYVDDGSSYDAAYEPSLDADDDGMYYEESLGDYMESADDYDYSWGDWYRPETQARAGLLTGGEWRDNSNYAFWNSLFRQREDWDNVRYDWKIDTSDRVYVKVTGSDKRPAAGLTVKLASGSTLLWQKLQGRL